MKLPEVFCKKEFFKIPQNSQENTCVRVSFLISCRPETYNFIKKETLAQVFSCEFCEIFKSIFFTEHLRMNASTFRKVILKNFVKFTLKTCDKLLFHYFPVYLKSVFPVSFIEQILVTASKYQSLL